MYIARNEDDTRGALAGAVPIGTVALSRSGVLARRSRAVAQGE